MVKQASDACRENSSNVKLYKNFKEVTSIKTNYAAEGLSGGTLLGVRGSDFVCFYDWASGKVCVDSSTVSACQLAGCHEALSLNLNLVCKLCRLDWIAVTAVLYNDMYQKQFKIMPERMTSATQAVHLLQLHLQPQSMQ